jgi:predicted Zn-ribbon and HTH transcriptional regulator
MKAKKYRDLSILPEHHETIRQKIIVFLEGGEASPRDIARETGISEREVTDHLTHIQKSITNTEYTLRVTPAKCNKCGFVFRKRTRLSKPGKCPICRNKSIHPPLFSIRGKAAKSH